MNFSQVLPIPTESPRPLIRPAAGGKHAVVGTLPIGLGDVLRIQDERRATVIGEEHDRVDVYEWTVGVPAKVASLALPQDMYATDTVLKGATIFVAGGYRWPTESGEILIARRIDGGDWTPIEIPEHCRRRGKTIDALLLDGARLIAVDNTIKPKWFLEYHVEKPERPMLLGTPEFRHQPDEHAQGAVMGERFVALRSVAATNEAFERYIRLYDRQTLVECAYATASHKAVPGSYRDVTDPLGRDERVSNRQWHDMAFVGDKLVIAGGQDGFGVVATKGIKTLEKVGPAHRTPPPAYLGEDDVQFHTPPAGKEVVAVIPVPQFGGCYAIEQSAVGRSARWHKVVTG